MSASGFSNIAFRSGNFDVVILQSVARDDMPDVGGNLSGNPVYTVYLKVGDEREWLLEYCIPIWQFRRGHSAVGCTRRHARRWRQLVGQSRLHGLSEGGR